MSPVTNTMPESTVKLEIRSYDSESKKHCHRYHQLVLPLAGELWLAVDHQEGAVVRHKAAVIPSDRNHGFAAPADNRFLVADVPEQAAPDLERVPRFVELDPALLHYVRFLEAQVSLRQPPATDGVVAGVGRFWGSHAGTDRRQLAHRYRLAGGRPSPFKAQISGLLQPLSNNTISASFSPLIWGLD